MNEFLFRVFRIQFFCIPVVMIPHNNKNFEARSCYTRTLIHNKSFRPTTINHRLNTWIRKIRKSFPGSVFKFLFRNLTATWQRKNSYLLILFLFRNFFSCVLPKWIWINKTIKLPCSIRTKALTSISILSIHMCTFTGKSCSLSLFFSLYRLSLLQDKVYSLSQQT